MSLLLTLEHGPRGQPVRQTRLDDGELVIGRSAEADWQIDDPDMYVSRAHCTVSARGGRLFRHRHLEQRPLRRRWRQPAGHWQLGAAAQRHAAAARRLCGERGGFRRCGRSAGRRPNRGRRETGGGARCRCLQPGRLLRGSGAGGARAAAPVRPAGPLREISPLVFPGLRTGGRRPPQFAGIRRPVQPRRDRNARRRAGAPAGCRRSRERPVRLRRTHRRAVHRGRGACFAAGLRLRHRFRYRPVGSGTAIPRPARKAAAADAAAAAAERRCRVRTWELPATPQEPPAPARPVEPAPLPRPAGATPAAPEPSPFEPIAAAEPIAARDMPAIGRARPMPRAADRCSPGRTNFPRPPLLPLPRMPNCEPRSAGPRRGGNQLRRWRCRRRDGDIRARISADDGRADAAPAQARRGEGQCAHRADRGRRFRGQPAQVHADRRGRAGAS